MSLVHHTKSKGDLGVAKAHADLVEQGFLVLFPATEHAPFDGDGRVLLPPTPRARQRVTLRITPTLNGQVAGVRLASSFRRLGYGG